MTADPRTYDYSQPTRTCDVVMKGGITSGVVYPHALCELARTYRFANVGGTSAGAIAAAGAAAAEHGREQGGFEKLAALPEWIGGGENLVGLFQPSPGTRSYHRLLMSGLGRTGAGKWLRIGSAALRSFPLAAALGLAPGVALVVLALWTGSGALAVCAVVAGIVLALLGLAIALGLQLGVGLPRALGRNRFGLCSGLSPEGSATPALTPWLAALVDDLAAKDGDGPLTFGDLRAKGIELQMMTTNITHRRPHRMPWGSRELLFDPDELRQLFPERIVAWMEEHPPPLGAGRDAEKTKRRLDALHPLRPFPAPDDLPVVVAARMSLSFPLLISAVPLHALDMTRTHVPPERSGGAAGRVGYTHRVGEANGHVSTQGKPEPARTERERVRVEAVPLPRCRRSERRQTRSEDGSHRTGERERDRPVRCQSHAGVGLDERLCAAAAREPAQRSGLRHLLPHTRHSADRDAPRAPGPRRDHTDVHPRPRSGEAEHPRLSAQADDH